MTKKVPLELLRAIDDLKRACSNLNEVWGKYNETDIINDDYPFETDFANVSSLVCGWYWTHKERYDEQDVLYEHIGIKFDDVFAGDETSNVCARICEPCVGKHGIDIDQLTYDGIGLCGINGCNNEADYTIDLDTYIDGGIDE